MDIGRISFHNEPNLENGIRAMDKFDTAILKVLQEDGQTPFTELGEKVGLSPSACHKRVKEL